MTNRQADIPTVHNLHHIVPFSSNPGSHQEYNSTEQRILITYLLSRSQGWSLQGFLTFISTTQGDLIQEMQLVQDSGKVTETGIINNY